MFHENHRAHQTLEKIECKLTFVNKKMFMHKKFQLQSQEITKHD